ncbi:peroxiredoxin [Roseimicrobium gellanilyticum]|uniref:Peroxiredoxin n=1 Tax=Roseimicrobium gellanilyticum TaxID=748857 RepID=A0A366HPF9_9BACT|nr:TlpA disulfide reductase family protein [Roseimicrobium gellanilyticum]RBP45377.1 peroxiredoxin [Roseimicrobium gellanilyticum]
MANELTGDYEAVLQVSVRQVNGLLATLHQNGDIPQRSPSLPHVIAYMIGQGTTEPGPSPGIGGLHTWIAGQKLWQDSGTFKVYRENAVKVAAPGVASRLSEAIIAIQESIPGLIMQSDLHGKVEVQVSSPTISLGPRADSEVMVRASIRARYLPAPGTATLPDPIHGDVNIAYEVSPATNPQGQRVLKVTPSGSDSKVYFERHAGTSTSAAESDKISGELRKLVRGKLRPLDLVISQDFPFAAFKGMGDAIALPMQMSGGVAPSAGLGTIQNLFLGGSEYAIAVSKDHIGALLAPLMDSVKASLSAFRINVTILFVSGTYHASFSSGPALAWKAGTIEISGNVALTTSSALPNGFVSFKQSVTLELHAPTQTVTLKAAGDPVVDESWFISHNTAVGAVKSAIANALASASPQVNATFASIRARFNGGLKSFDDSAEARFDAVEITPHGIVIRGSVTTRYHYAPIVDVRETPDGKSFSALHSWIPGGRVDRFIWTWVKEHQIPWFGEVKQRVEEHRFLLTKPAEAQSLSRVCLKIEGTQLDANGVEQPIVAGRTCQVSEREPILVQPPWWEIVYLPIWLPRPPEQFLEEIIAGYVNVLGERGPSAGRGINTLVRFASLEVETPMRVIQKALQATGNRIHPLSVVWVLPAGTFQRASYREIESRLRELEGDFPVSVELAEDMDGGWSRTFAAGDVPATFLLNARGEFVWKQEQEGNLDEMVQVLQYHLTPALAPAFKPLSLALQRGAAVPDFEFEDQHGTVHALHRFRGREVLLLFWQSWSSPCRKELQRCQRLHADGGKDGEKLEIIAVHGGPDPEAIHEASRESGARFLLTQDGEHRIARMFGVRCWPTAVRIGRDGALREATFGLVPEREMEPAGKATPKEAL